MSKAQHTARRCTLATWRVSLISLYTLAHPSENLPLLEFWSFSRSTRPVLQQRAPGIVKAGHIAYFEHLPCPLDPVAAFNKSNHLVVTEP